MLYRNYRDHKILNYKSLIFNAGNMNDANTTGSDTEQLGGSGIFILGWLMPRGDTDEYSLTFSVPKDARKGYNKSRVFVHLISDNSSIPMGDRFSIRLSSLFAKANEAIDIDNLSTVNKENIRVKHSPGSQQYNHYVIEFFLDDFVHAEDFALLSIARIPAINDYAGAVAVTSIEFRYISY
ncbi:hypothetical protein [Lacrimispora sp.]|uniref:hypothetical protein n=1 Tax=Lacrimispora sp. TaxID=2719234 RepID=UPI0028A8A3FF|nr:hypothetical protein [Lacrimispora sp.]